MHERASSATYKVVEKCLKSNKQQVIWRYLYEREILAGGGGESHRECEEG